MLKYNNHLYKANFITKPKLRVLFIHHGGGSALNYFKFKEYFPSKWEIIFLDMPGRSSHISENHIKNRKELQIFSEKIIPDLKNVPLAIFGHSMGALIAFEFANFIHLTKQIDVIWLGISGKKPPNIANKSNSKMPIYLSSNEHLKKSSKNF